LSSSQHSTPLPSSNIVIPEKKVFYNVLAPDTARKYENLDRSLRSNLIVNSKVETKSQNYLVSSSR